MTCHHGEDERSQRGPIETRFDCRMIMTMGESMSEVSELNQVELVNLLNKCWMTHDGMWFLHCVQECGIETTNRLNKSAIKSLAPFEIKRIAGVLGMSLPLKNHHDCRRFFHEAAKLIIPDFMNAAFDLSIENRMSWNFDAGDCFAYTGISRLGVIDQYECGVLYRIKCWLGVLGIKNQFHPEIGHCYRHHEGACQGHIDLFFTT